MLRNDRHRWFCRSALVPGFVDCVERLRPSASSSRFGPKVVEASAGRWTVVDCEPSSSQGASLRGKTLQVTGSLNRFHLLGGRSPACAEFQSAVCRRLRRRRS